MSLPPPPGLRSHPTAQQQPPSSLPVRPPVSLNAPPAASKSALPSTHNSNGVGSGKATYGAFTAFAPRSVISSNFKAANLVQYAAPPTPSYTNPSQYLAQQDGYSSQRHYDPQSYTTDSSGPQIRNPFAPPTAGTSSTGFGGAPPVDPEMEAQILQWQSAYMSKDDIKTPFGAARRDGATGANTAPLGSASRIETALPAIGPSSHSTTTTSTTIADQQQNNTNTKTVHRSGGGTKWTDSTLLEWDPAHFRLFVGNLAGEVTDESLLKAFSKYPSVQKARVVRDKRTSKSRGYGFVSFSDGDEYFAAGREMQGKYIGSHPVLLKRSNTEVRAESQTVGGSHKQQAKHGGGRGGKSGTGGGGGGGVAGLGKKEHGGINKKQPKTKGGLRVLG